MTKILHPGPGGRTLQFQSTPGLYPVNRYQSLLLAAVAHSETLAYAERVRRPLPKIRVMEACCGSGPVAVFLKSAGVGYVQAADINPRALKSCRANARINGVILDSVIHRDILAVETSEPTLFDLVACNPPCGLRDTCPDGASEDLRVAVDGGVDGVRFTLRLLEVARAFLRLGGVFLFVLTSSVVFAKVVQKLNTTFPNAWRMAYHTPVAQPWRHRDWRHADLYLERAETGEFFVWDGGDGWIWRLSWIIVAHNGKTCEGGITDLWFRNVTYNVPADDYCRLLRRFEKHYL